MPAFVKALNKVDLPTFGRPTIPHFKLMSVPVSEARKCMPWGRARLAMAWCTLLWCVHAAALPAPTVLRDEQGTLDAQPIVRSWVDVRGDAALAQVLETPALFQPAVPGAAHRLPKQGALWLQLRLQRADAALQDWI